MSASLDRRHQGEKTSKKEGGEDRGREGEDDERRGEDKDRNREIEAKSSFIRNTLA